MEEKMESKDVKTNKPIYRKGWFIAIAIVVAIICLINISNFVKGATKSKKIDLANTQLGKYLPDLPKNKGEITYNTDDYLQIILYDISQGEYNDYKKKCEEKGFNIDISSGYSFEAYNEESYRLSMYMMDKTKMDISISAPTKTSKITWATSELVATLPVPKSNEGYIITEKANDFNVTLGNMSKDDYDAYVNECSTKGYNVNYDKGDKLYKADNNTGFHLEVSYNGGKRVNIHVKSDSNNVSSSSNSSNTATPATPSTPSIPTAPTPSNDSNGLSKEFKDAMDSYENFMNEYVEFMKKYQANSSDITLISQYATMVQKYSEQVSAFEKWNSENLTTEEAAYYIDVQSRVSKKLLEVN